MDCSCGGYSGDYEMPEIFEEAIRKANKTHECCECGEDILSGKKYKYVRGLWGGNFSTYKTCIGCSRLRDAIDGYPYGSLNDIVWDCFGTIIIGD